MKQEVKIGTTDYTVLILIRDTAGAAKTGLTNASAGIDVCYTRVETDNDVVVTAGAPVALATPALTDVHLDWGFLEVDATNAPGIYRLDLADGVFAAGAWSAVVSLIATGIDPVHIEFSLVAVDKTDGVRMGLTALPNAIPGEAGGVAIAGSNAATTFATLSITGQLDAGNVLVDGTTVLTGTTTLTGAVSLGSTLGVTGAATLASLSVTGQLDAGNLLVDTTTVLTGNVSFGGTFGVTGLSTLAALTVTGAMTVGTNAIPWNAAYDAEVQSEVVDALNVDTYAEPGQGIPPATAALTTKINYLYKMWRNKKMQDATTFELFDDAGTTVDQKATVSDDGTDYTHGEIVSGP